MKQLFASVLILLLVTGCSNRLTYRFADTLVEWKLNKYVDLSGQLERDVSASTDELHRWHAQTQLPAYRDLLLKIRADLTRKDLTQQDLLLTSYSVYALWENIQLQIEPYAQVYLPRLSASQRTQLIQAMQEDIDEDLEEIQEESYEKSRKKRYERMEEAFEDLLGELTPAQHKHVEQWLEQRDDDMRMAWIDYQQSWLDAFAAVLTDPAVPDYQQRVYSLIVEPEKLRSAELQSRLDANRAASLKLIHKIYQSMTDKQKRHLLDEIDSFLADLNNLIETYST
ncbi:hypothetical protein IDSA_04035 [Pseudidiomarina salinarum]|uniref:Lipoprotein n=1 Tax=Pseudidiomarina salinarum TaxID=435908 RepID=A0A094LAL1_9GAMM|nr:DUF6279 family lipoprotein [Pseudidiomarina salinarum]KFZ31863.1 hypothetical protein IDSA_04035 [Pseudidiomarina salinarum]RUO70365.1 hypothetical protein CWI79_02545 [Pseudidiomarina salinarum]